LRQTNFFLRFRNNSGLDHSQTNDYSHKTGHSTQSVKATAQTPTPKQQRWFNQQPQPQPQHTGCLSNSSKKLPKLKLPNQTKIRAETERLLPNSFSEVPTPPVV
jgi:hypothetical protein